MTHDDSDNFPTVIGRPVFDTVPCPPDFLGMDDGKPVRVSANGRASFPLHCQPPPAPIDHGRDVVVFGKVPLAFHGGDVSLPKPTRADLVLSAQQWAKSVRECYLDEFYDVVSPAAERRMSGKLDRLDAALAELAAIDKTFTVAAAQVPK